MRDTVVKSELVKPDISAIVSNYAVLRSVGKNMRALCPFHAERTPSFFIRPYSQTFVCYGCGAKGDVIQFIMQIENLDFKDACKSLGIELRPGRKTEQELRKKELLRKFKTWCADYLDYLSSIYRNLQTAKEKIKTEKAMEAFAPYYHKESLWLYHIEILLSNEEEAKFNLYREVVYGKV